MTKRERAIISTYTGILCCEFIDMCLYVEELIGRGVMTHELARSDFTDELKEKYIVNVYLPEIKPPSERHNEWFVKKTKWNHEDFKTQWRLFSGD